VLSAFLIVSFTLRCFIYNCYRLFCDHFAKRSASESSLWQTLKAESDTEKFGETPDKVNIQIVYQMRKMEKQCDLWRSGE